MTTPAPADAARRRRLGWGARAAWGGALLIAVEGLAHAEAPVARAVLASSSPVIDGRLDELAWREAPMHGDFVERRPKLRQTPPVATRFRVLYDAEALYFGVECDDTEAPRASSRLRDSYALYDDDAVTVKIDAQNDQRTTLGFAVNPLGARLDYRGVNEGDFDNAFDAVWQVGATRSATGWTAEIRVPWAALGIDPHEPPASVGLDISRDHARRAATYDWSLLPPPYGPLAASLYGRLEGFEQVRDLHLGSEVRATLTPYALGGYRRSRDGDEALFTGGADLSVEVGPRWAMQLTLNTDFAQVDLDDQVVNYGRFDLFLPEKRTFFQKDADLYSFGRLRSLQAYYSRSIGLSGDGAAIPIMGGLKMLGRPADGARIGVTQVVTRGTDDEPWTNHLVARGQLELGRGSNAGLIGTYRQSLENERDRNAVVGVDGAWRGDGTPFVVDSFAMLSTTGQEAPSLGSAPVDRPMPAAGVSLGYRGEVVHPSASFAYVHPGFRADMGFVERTGVERADVGIDVTPRIGAAGLEKLALFGGADLVADASDDRILDWSAGGGGTLLWDEGFAVSASGGYRSEEVLEAFTVGRETTIEPDRYVGVGAEVALQTPSSYWLSGGVDLYRQAYYGGIFVGATSWLVARPEPLVRLEAGLEYARAIFDDLPDFSSLLVNARLSLGFTTALGVDFYAAYNLLAELVRWQGRLRWSYLEGADLFVVQQIDVDSARAVPVGSSLAVKSSFPIF